ncbi:MAG: hypothetical protein ABIS21_04805 [Acidimicrobiales bacterium]
MSLWTPDGERAVPRQPVPEPERSTLDPDGIDGIDGIDLDSLSEEDTERLEDMAAHMAEVRAQLLQVPAATVVANHAMGLYELAAIHLGAEAPKLAEAVLAIDGLAALVEGLEGRLGEPETTLREALVQLRAAYLAVRGRVQGGTDPSPT